MGNNEPQVHTQGERTLIAAARERADELQPLQQSRPTKIGRFEIVAVLGEGGFGAVYKAFDPKLNRYVAVKKPYPRAAATETQLARIAREAQTAAQLNHEHIVGVHEVFEDDGVPIIVSEVVDGRTLMDAIALGDLSLRDSLQLTAKIARAIDYSHRQGVVHRDLKPSNILIDKNHTPRITDFGLARRPGLDVTLTQHDQFLGTPSYMSPEQCSGDEVGASSDIYNLGVILYQQLTGRLPFEAAGIDVFERIRYDEPTPPRRIVDDIPPAVEAIILKCLQKTPTARYPTAGALADDLTAFLAGEPVSAQRSSIGRGLSSVFRDTRHARALPAFAPLLLLESAYILVMGLATAFMHHVYNVDSHIPYFLVWAAAMVPVQILSGRFVRLSESPTFLEREMLPIWRCGVILWWSIALTELSAGLDVLTLSPLFPLIWAALWAITARLMSRKLYLQSAAYVVCFLLMLLLPGIRMFVFTAFTTTISFATGINYLRPKTAAE